MNKFKSYDLVEVLNPCCEDHMIGQVTDMIPIKTKFGDSYEVTFGGGGFSIFLESELRPYVEPQALVVDLPTRVALEYDSRTVAKKPKMVNDNGVDYIDLGNGVRMFETGAVRSTNNGKPRFDLISPLAHKWMAECLADNGGTYGTGNYLAGIPEEVCIESLERHLNTVKHGLLLGDENCINEAVNVLINAMFLCHTIRLKEAGMYRVSDDYNELRYGQKGEGKAA